MGKRNQSARTAFVVTRSLSLSSLPHKVNSSRVRSRNRINITARSVPDISVGTNYCSYISASPNVFFKSCVFVVWVSERHFNIYLILCGVRLPLSAARLSVVVFLLFLLVRSWKRMTDPPRKYYCQSSRFRSIVVSRSPQYRRTIFFFFSLYVELDVFAQTPTCVYSASYPPLSFTNRYRNRFYCAPPPPTRFVLHKLFCRSTPIVFHIRYNDNSRRQSCHGPLAAQRRK